MLINTYLDTEDFVHLYYPEDEQPSGSPQGCGAGARMHTKYARPPSPHYDKITITEMMGERDRTRAPPPPEPPPHRVRAADLYPRIRTHYDEPGLDAPFTPICAEFVQWVGRTADNGILAMSNYRVHVQPRRRNGSGLSMPLRMVDSVEVRDLVHLILLCKDGKTLKCSFNTGEQCLEWWRRLNNALAPISSVQDTFAAAYAAWAREQPPASVHRALLRATAAHRPHWFGAELERLGFTHKGAWRVSTSNAEFKLCPSYPPLLIVPSSFDDDDLEAVARFRAMRRIPTVVWRHRGNGAVLARSSQPEVGWLGWRSSDDEKLLAAFVSACNMDRGLQPHNTSKNTKLLIVDARSYASAVTNRARGGGVECQQYYPHADIQFMCLPNIHHVRKSFQQLRELLAQPADQPNWHSALERTLWLQYLSGVGQAASLVSSALLAGRPVLVHCSDGWDRTPQLAAAAQLQLDPYYRTAEGFRVLVTREWLEFGHKFAARCGHADAPEPNERSPVFLQWLDLVHQMLLQHPTSFEFSQAYLIKLLTHVHSCMFGTFLCNSAKERAEARLPDATADVWTLLEGPAYRNHLYTPPHGEQVLWTDFNVRALVPWWALYGGRREPDDDADSAAPAPPPHHPHPPHAAHAPHPPPASGAAMTKTRSCDNLLGEGAPGERRPPPRRCSDPSLAADLAKLTSILPNSDSSSSLGRLCRAPPSPSPSPPAAPATPSAAMTDSVVDCLARNTNGDQVDGLHPNHFDQNGDVSPSLPRDLASNSSSLERELRPGGGGEPPTDYQDIMQIREAAREAARQRHVSITWRSVSESSHHTDSSVEIPAREGAAVNLNTTDIDLANHNVIDSPIDSPATLPVEDSTTISANHTPQPVVTTNHSNGADNATNHNNGAESATNHSAGVNGAELDQISAEILRVELGVSNSSSAASSESESSPPSEARRRRGARRGGSLQTLCPSPRRHCRHVTTTDPSNDPHCACRSTARALCVCGGGGGGAGGPGGAGGGRDPLDGLPPAADPLQARLHQIILRQRMVVEDLSQQLKEARAALEQRVTSPPPAAPAGPHTPHTPGGAGAPSSRASPPELQQLTSSISSGASSLSSGSGSGSEVELGVEARWLPDAAAPRCQHCSNHFWLARRRHHCRRCGGIFCGSCSELSSVGEWPSVRLCRPCRADR